MAVLNVNACIDADDVREIIDTDLSDARLHNFINMAYFRTLPLSGKLDDCGGGDMLCQIQLLLAAHFLTMFERQTKSEKVDSEWAVTYLGVDGEGLKASLYGQQAIALDCSGILAKAGMKRATIEVKGYIDLDAGDTS